MSKVIFLDVDGTLCNYEGVIPESAKQAIKQARKNGHKVYICTGRSRAEVYQEIWDIGLDGMIGRNGSYVEDQSKSVYHKKLSETEERAVVDWLHERGLEFSLGVIRIIWMPGKHSVTSKQALGAEKTKKRFSETWGERNRQSKCH